MIIKVENKTKDFESYRAQRVKSLFNAEDGSQFVNEFNIEIDDLDWGIGLIVGASGSGKTSIGKQFFGENKICNLYANWEHDKPIIDCILPNGAFDSATGALAAVGLGDVPSWLRPFHALSNGQQFRAGLARLVTEAPNEVVVDEFTSVVDRQIAKIGALAFAKNWRKNKGKKVVLLSCHYDIIEWLQPDWVYDVNTKVLKKKIELGNRPEIKLDIWKVNGTFWKFFKEHYYLDLPHPPAAEYFVGVVNGELVAHVAVCPLFTATAYRATRLVVMPEWQGAGVGTAFLNEVMQYHLEGNGRCARKYHTFFHTSHPQLAGYLRNTKKWLQTGAMLFGSNKTRSNASIVKTGNKKSGITGCGYGGHFRAVQSFKYLGE